MCNVHYMFVEGHWIFVTAFELLFFYFISDVFIELSVQNVSNCQCNPNSKWQYQTPFNEEISNNLDDTSKKRVSIEIKNDRSGIRKPFLPTPLSVG